MNHPGTAEWMAYLYDEVAPERKRELHAHLAECALCGSQLNRWRAGMSALEEWQLPATRRGPRQWHPVTLWKWAAAAVIVVGMGFALGRQTSPAAGEIVALKASLAQLSETVERERRLSASNAMAAAGIVASEETIRLLSGYTRIHQERQSAERRTVALALLEMESRLTKLRTELETVAVNTESGFQQTQRGLTELASYAVADREPPTLLLNPQTQ